MPLHRQLVAVDVDRLAALLGELDRELEREAVGRGERERVLAGDRTVACKLVEDLHAALERLGEALLLGAHDALDLAGVLAQLGIRVLHLLDDDGRQAVDVAETDPVRLMHGAPDHATQDVAATFVGRLNAVGDEERHPAAVVGEDPMRLRRVGRVAVRDAAIPPRSTA